MTWSKRCSQSTSQGSSLMSPFQKPRKDSCPGHWPQWPFTDLDDRVPHPVRLPAGSWVEMLDDAKDEFEADGTAAVFSTWRVEEEDLLDIGDVEIADGMRARAGRLALDTQMADERAARLLDSLPEGQFLLKLKFLRENEDDWVLEDVWSNPGWAKEGPGGHQGLPRDTKPGVLTGIDSVFYQNAYPITAVVYGLYPIRDPDPANLAPLKTGDLNCVAQRVLEHFESASRGHGLTSTRRWKLQDWLRGVHETGASVDDVAELEKILWRPIILRDTAGEYIFNSGKYQSGHQIIELIWHNGHAWSEDLHFPQSREVHIYEGDVWHAIWGEPLTVWLLGGRGRRLSVDQFVLQDSRTYRTREAHNRLKSDLRRIGQPRARRQSLRPELRGLHYGKREERLEANPREPPPWHREGLCGARSRWPLELDELSHEGSCQHWHEGLLSGIFPGHGWSQTLFPAVRTSDSPHDPCSHQWRPPQRHRHRLRRG